MKKNHLSVIQGGQTISKSDDQSLSVIQGGREPEDPGVAAQRAAEAHLGACQDALWAEEEGSAVASPASAPFCGCDTCIVREVLWAAWDYLAPEGGESA